MTVLKNPLERRYGQRHLHFITCSCYRRRPLLGTARKRDAFLKILDEVRERYQFSLVGYVVMPEHVHLLISEPEVGNPSTAMQAPRTSNPAPFAYPAKSAAPAKDKRSPRW